MKYSKNRVTWFISLALISTELVAYDFDCNGAKQIAKTLSLGPDRLVRKFQDKPKWFVNRQIPGWKCLTDPYPPERNNQIYLESLTCLRSNERYNPTEQEFVNAGRTYKKNVGKLLKCFPDNINSTPVTYSNSSKGEGLRVAIGEFVDNPYGKNHHIILEYGYSQDSDSPIIWEISASIGSPEIATVGGNSKQFCDLLNKVIGQAPRGFRLFRGRYDREFKEYSSKLMLPGAEECTIEKDQTEHTFSCSWLSKNNPEEMENLFEELNDKVENCAGSQIVRKRERESNGRTFRRMYMRDDQLSVRTTMGTRERRNGDLISTVRFYAEYERD